MTDAAAVASGTAAGPNFMKLDVSYADDASKLKWTKVLIVASWIVVPCCLIETIMGFAMLPTDTATPFAIRGLASMATSLLVLLGMSAWNRGCCFAKGFWVHLGAFLTLINLAVIPLSTGGVITSISFWQGKRDSTAQELLDFCNESRTNARAAA